MLNVVKSASQTLGGISSEYWNYMDTTWSERSSDPNFESDLEQPRQQKYMRAFRVVVEDLEKQVASKETTQK